LDATIEEMLADYWAHTFVDDPKAADEIEDDDFNPDDVANLIGAPSVAPDDWEEVR
jgi:hypothetical protein